VVAVLEQIGGIQAQYAPSMYIGLWSRVEEFERAHLTKALAERSVVQGTLMRSTIHLVSRRDYWPCALAVRAARRAWYVRTHRSGATPEEREQAAAIVLARLRTGPATRSEIADLIPRHVFEGIHEFADIIRVPPSGTWERRRADLYGSAEHWIGPEPALEHDEAVDHLVRRYLAAFGPARQKDIADWAGLPVTTVRSSVARLPTTGYVAENGQPLVDLDDGVIPPADARAPVRFLPTWDATLLVHARRAGLIEEEDRPRVFHTRRPQSAATFLVDGTVAGTWLHRDGRVVIEPFRPLPPRVRQELIDEAERIEQLFRPPVEG
jgi:Winged helix DNA-binding domain